MHNRHINKLRRVNWIFEYNFFPALDPNNGKVRTIPAVDIGLGLQPDLTRQGLGLFYVRAIRVYERVGFLTIETFVISTESEAHEFVQMVWEK